MSLCLWITGNILAVSLLCTHGCFMHVELALSHFVSQTCILYSYTWQWFIKWICHSEENRPPRWDNSKIQCSTRILHTVYSMLSSYRLKRSIIVWRTSLIDYLEKFKKFKIHLCISNSLSTISEFKINLYFNYSIYWIIYFQLFDTGLNSLA